MTTVCFLALALGAGPLPTPTKEQAQAERKAGALFTRAQAEWAAGRQAQCIATLEQALAQAEQAHGPHSRLGAALCSWMAGRERERGRWAASAGHAERSADIREVLEGRDHWRAVDARWNARTIRLRAGFTPAQHKEWEEARRLNVEAWALLRQGQAAKALPLAERALEVRRRLAGEKHPIHLASLNTLATVRQRLGDHKAALPLFRRALALRREALGEWHSDHGEALNNLALLLHEMGEHKAALPLSRQGVAVALAVHGPAHAKFASGLANLGVLSKELGDYRAALLLHRRAAAVLKEALGERHPDYSLALHNLGVLHMDLGDPRAALPLLRQALAAQKEVLGGKHPMYANTLNSLGLLYKDMGDLGAALPLLRQALAAFKDGVGEKHHLYAGALTNLAALLMAMKDKEGALGLGEKAVALTLAARGEKHPTYALALGNLATMRQEAGDHGAALGLFKRALALNKEAFGDKHPRYAAALHTLARQLRVMGDREAALPLFRQALAIRKEALGEGHPDYANTLNSLAFLHLRMGDHAAALPLSERSLAAAFAQLRDLASVQSDRQQLAAAYALRYRLSVRLSIRDAPGGPGGVPPPGSKSHPPAAAHVLAWKGAILMRQTQRRLFLRVADDPAAREAAARLQEVTRRLAALRHSPAATRERLDALLREQEDAQARLALLSQSFRETRDEGRASPEALAKALPEGAVLVDYLFHGGRLSAFVHRRGRTAARIDLGRDTPVLDAVFAWAHLLRAAKPCGMPAAALKRLIWLPLEKHLGRAKVVLVSPDSALGLVPFAALPGRKSGSYLVEEVAIATVPVPQTLPDLLAPPKKAARLPPSLLVVGDVDYDTVRAAVARADDRRSAPLGLERKWTRLPATFAEAAAVGKAFRGLFAGGTLTDLSKGEAAKPAVREALGKVRYAHVATHGYFAPEPRGPATRGDADGEGRAVTGWHPLLLSGLALSGANREPKGGEEDGILTALEVSEMDLSKLELAVLSACETGLGGLTTGEGLLGMQRAFHTAGARSVIASLWKVDDRATQALMADFYRAAWDPDTVISRAEALRRAQLSMLREGVRRGVVGELHAEKGTRRVPPYYWAAFVLSGDWR